MLNCKEEESATLEMLTRITAHRTFISRTWLHLSHVSFSQSKGRYLGFILFRTLQADMSFQSETKTSRCRPETAGKEQPKGCETTQELFFKCISKEVEIFGSRSFFRRVFPISTKICCRVLVTHLITPIPGSLNSGAPINYYMKLFGIKITRPNKFKRLRQKLSYWYVMAYVRCWFWYTDISPIHRNLCFIYVRPSCKAVFTCPYLHHQPMIHSYHLLSV